MPGPVMMHLKPTMAGGAGLFELPEGGGGVPDAFGTVLTRLLGTGLASDVAGLTLTMPDETPGTHSNEFGARGRGQIKNEDAVAAHAGTILPAAKSETLQIGGANAPPGSGNIAAGVSESDETIRGEDGSASEQFPIGLPQPLRHGSARPGHPAHQVVGSDKPEPEGLRATADPVAPYSSRSVSTESSITTSARGRAVRHGDLIETGGDTRDIAVGTCDVDVTGGIAPVSATDEVQVKRGGDDGLGAVKDHGGAVRRHSESGGEPRRKIAPSIQVLAEGPVPILTPVSPAPVPGPTVGSRLGNLTHGPALGVGAPDRREPGMEATSDPKLTALASRQDEQVSRPEADIASGSSVGSAVADATPEKSAIHSDLQANLVPTPIQYGVLQTAPAELTSSLISRQDHEVSSSDGNFAAPALQVASGLVEVLKGTDGGQSVTIRLQPADLGQVQIRIDRTTDGMSHFDIKVEKPETLQLLLRDQGRLQQTLDQAGVPSNGRSVSFQTAAPEQIGASAARPDSMALGADGAGRGQSGGAWRESDDLRRESGDGHGAEPERTQVRWFRSGLDITA